MRFYSLRSFVSEDEDAGTWPPAYYPEAHEQAEWIVTCHKPIVTAIHPVTSHYVLCTGPHCCYCPQKIKRVWVLFVTAWDPRTKKEMTLTYLSQSCEWFFDLLQFNSRWRGLVITTQKKYAYGTRICVLDLKRMTDKFLEKYPDFPPPPRGHQLHAMISNIPIGTQID